MYADIQGRDCPLLCFWVFRFSDTLLCPSIDPETPAPDVAMATPHNSSKRLNEVISCLSRPGSPIIPILSWKPVQFLVLMPISLRSILILSSHLRLGLHRGLFRVNLPVIILKALLPSSILATCIAHLNVLELITLTILGERYKLLSSHSHPSWAKIFASSLFLSVYIYEGWWLSHDNYCFPHI